MAESESAADLSASAEKSGRSGRVRRKGALGMTLIPAYSAATADEHCGELPHSGLSGALSESPRAERMLRITKDAFSLLMPLSIRAFSAFAAQRAEPEPSQDDERSESSFPSPRAEKARIASAAPGATSVPFSAMSPGRRSSPMALRPYSPMICRSGSQRFMSAFPLILKGPDGQ